MDTNASPQANPRRDVAEAVRPEQTTSGDRTSTRGERGRMKVDGWSSAMLDDFGLDVYAFRVYHTIARRAGADGTCYESVANMAERCRMSERRLHNALRELERRGLVERIVRAGRTSVYRRLTPTGTPAPHAEVPLHLVQGGTATRADEGLPMKVNPRKEGGAGAERTTRGATAAAANRDGRARLPQELDIDRDPPPAAPPAADDLGMDPRLIGSEALMDRLTGKGSGIRDAHAARVFFTRLLGAQNAKHPQVEPRRLDWYRQHGEAYIESVWREAITNPDPRNARSAPLFYFVDALNGRFLPRAHADREIARAAAREPDPALEPGTLVMLPNGETHVLDVVAGLWSYLEGVSGTVRTSDLRPVQEVRS